MSFSILIAYPAGVLSALSPCVLPLLPILVSSALQKHRLAPLFVALGLILSFSFLGILSGALTSIVDPHLLEVTNWIILLLVGFTLLSPTLQEKFAQLTAPFTKRAANSLEGIAGISPLQNIAIGALLGVVWVPCSGPLLGATITLAAQGQSLAFAFLTFFVFGLGAATPLLLVAYGARGIFLRYKGAIGASSSLTKRILGLALILIAMLALTGFDRVVESKLLSLSPHWLLKLSSSL